VASGAIIVGADAGQLSTGPTRRSATVFQFVPPDVGSYCVVVEERHDLNADCCPDGAETTPLGTPAEGCPAACAPIAGSDDNPTNSVVFRTIAVEAACTPLATANLDGLSLRVTRPDGDDVTTTLSWAVLSGFPGRFNVHYMEAERYDPSYCFQDIAPIRDRPIGVTQRSYDMPVSPGRPLWMAVFEQDGCPSANSIDDSSSNDPLLGCR
jgi:hypothetical protein